MKINYFKDSKRNLVSSAKRYFGPQYPYKRYNIAHKAIFIHVPKTAGTSIRLAMGAPGIGRLHIDYSHYLLANHQRFASYFKFAVVREPLARMHSCYQYIWNGGNQSQQDLLMSDRVQNHCNNFEDFVSFTYANQLHSLWPLLRPQASFICDTNNELMIDMVLFQENLESGYLDLVANVPTLKNSLQVLNSSGVQDGPTCSPATRSLVCKLYGLDYELFYPI